MLFGTHVGPVKSRASTAYLRPETAQGVYAQFQSLVNTARKRLPFGVGQMGRSFRQEIGTSNFIFRTREFEQMELQFFTSPEESEGWQNHWVETSYEWLRSCGIRKENMRLAPHDASSLAHYALGTTDIEYRFPFGWGEVAGVSNRGDYDLRQHAAASGVDLRYSDDSKGKVEVC
jgi:glycyl-tRNA synthetase